MADRIIAENSRQMKLHPKGYRHTGAFGRVNRNRMVYLYVIGCGLYVKVGIARDPTERLKDMSCDNPFDLRLLAKREVAAREASQAEFEAHRDLSSYHHSGEWFFCNPKMAIAAIYRAGGRAATRFYKIRDAEAEGERARFYVVEKNGGFEIHDGYEDDANNPNTPQKSPRPKHTTGSMTYAPHALP